MTPSGFVLVLNDWHAFRCTQCQEYHPYLQWHTKKSLSRGEAGGRGLWSSKLRWVNCIFIFLILGYFWVSCFHNCAFWSQHAFSKQQLIQHGLIFSLVQNVISFCLMETADYFSFSQDTTAILPSNASKITWVHKKVYNVKHLFPWNRFQHYKVHSVGICG